MYGPFDRVPSLDLVRGFVAVARRMSVTAAADDLLITQSAVSRQIRSLELALGVKLFDRRHRAISLTPEGKRLYSVAELAMRDLQRVVETISGEPLQRPVSITCPNGIASLWLLPRLTAFQRTHPGIELRIEASDKVERLESSGIDLAIRYSAWDSSIGNAFRLFDETAVLVAHPSLGLSPESAVDDVAKCCLLEFVGHRAPWLSWESWLGNDASKGDPRRSMLQFNRYDQVISAALTGQGVAIGRIPLVQDLLDEKRLIRAGSMMSRVATNHSYWLVANPDSPRPEVTDVVNWIKAQAVPSLIDTEDADAQTNAISPATPTKA